MLIAFLPEIEGDDKQYQTHWLWLREANLVEKIRIIYRRKPVFSCLKDFTQSGIFAQENVMEEQNLNGMLRNAEDYSIFI